MPKRLPQVVQVAPGIVVDPQIRFGQPVIKGTRVPVAVLLDELAGGSEVPDVAREYGITPTDVRAALRYAAGLLAGEDLLVAAR